MIDVNLDNISDISSSPTTGGYIAVIRSVIYNSNAAKPFLDVDFDIAEGEYAGYYEKLYNRKSFWGLNRRFYLTEKALPFFKGLITSVEESNRGYKWDKDENKLINKRVGVVLGEEEYWSAKNNEVRTKLVVSRVCGVKTITDGAFSVPPIKKLDGAPIGAVQSNPFGYFNSAPIPADESDLPF